MIEVINATTVEDAWRQAIYRLFEVGRIYTIDKGSFEGHQRLEFYPLVVIEIKFPEIQCSFSIEGKDVPNPVYSFEEGVQYLQKIFLDEKAPDEDYTYGQYIGPQLDYVIEKLASGPGTNQATITVGDNNSIKLTDPPCLKVVDFRLTEHGLDMVVYFRSWDLWAGFPNNLIALEVVRETVCEFLDLPAKQGQIIAVSKGLHLYDYCWPYAELLNNKNLTLVQGE